MAGAVLVPDRLHPHDLGREAVGGDAFIQARRRLDHGEPATSRRRVVDGPIAVGAKLLREQGKARWRTRRRADTAIDGRDQIREWRARSGVEEDHIQSRIDQRRRMSVIDILGTVAKVRWRVRDLGEDIAGQIDLDHPGEGVRGVQIDLHLRPAIRLRPLEHVAA